jgi:hypothetical protein
MTLSVEDLLAGGSATHRVPVPAALLPAADAALPAEVVLRPITVEDLRRIGRAAREDDELCAALMIQQSLVAPELTFAQVARLPAGLARFLVESVEELSGIGPAGDQIARHVHAPLARACYLLAREFGWTPEEVSAMTVGQILLYLEMMHADGAAR